MALTPLSITELLDLKPPEWLIDNVFPLGGFLAIYGPPGEGKSFLALDMALSIAAGVPWHGHEVRKGYVVYVSAEGGGGIGKRVGAWLDQHGITREDYGTVLAHFIVSTISVHPDSDDLRQILSGTVMREDYLHELQTYLDEGEDGPPLFLVVDTLARCFLGNENQQEDMGAFVRALDELRNEHAATVLVVHHTNVEGERERGNTAFRGACDTMVKAGKSGTSITLSCTKQKDAAEFEELQFELVQDEKRQSCVLEDRESQEKAEATRFWAYRAEHPHATIRELADALGMARSTVHRWLQDGEGRDRGAGQG